MGARRRFTPEYRRDVASLVLYTGSSIASVARDLGLTKVSSRPAHCPIKFSPVPSFEKVAGATLPLVCLPPIARLLYFETLHPCMLALVR